MKAKTSMSLTWEAEWVKEAKKTKPWYTKTPSSVVALLILAMIDLGGFIQGMMSFPHDFNTTSNSETIINTLALIILVAGFVAAFEGTTIYMAYAFSLKLYHYDRFALRRIYSGTSKASFSKFVSTSSLGWFCFFAFILGVIANIIFRIGTMAEKDFFEEGSLVLTQDGAIAIVLVILPIITSILNFVIGCFSFDPILFELNQLSKNIAKTEANIEQLKAQKKEANDELANILIQKETQKGILDSKIICVISLRPALRSRIYEDAMKGA